MCSERLSTCMHNYMYRIAPNFHGQKFGENVENLAYVTYNFRAKNFVVAPGEPTPTADRSNFRERIFCDQMSNHEIHENIVPRKVGAIQ